MLGRCQHNVKQQLMNNPIYIKSLQFQFDNGLQQHLQIPTVKIQTSLIQHTLLLKLVCFNLIQLGRLKNFNQHETINYLLTFCLILNQLFVLMAKYNRLALLLKHLLNFIVSLQLNILLQTNLPFPLQRTHPLHSSMRRKQHYFALSKGKQLPLSNTQIDLSGTLE